MRVPGISPARTTLSAVPITCTSGLGGIPALYACNLVLSIAASVQDHHVYRYTGVIPHIDMRSFVANRVSY